MTAIFHITSADEVGKIGVGLKLSEKKQNSPISIDSHQLGAHGPQRTFVAMCRAISWEPPLKLGVAMMYITTDCAKSIYKTTLRQLVAQSLSTLSDFLIGVQGKSEGPIQTAFHAKIS